MTGFNPGDSVHHARFGRGQVVVDQGESVVVRFPHGIEECLASQLEELDDLPTRLAEGRPDPALHVVARILAHCIRSVNDEWGVFARSRIALLPHQLWVCKRVLERWPARWLVADDVGLGKTIEAGLILTPLLSSGRVRRLLILAPASLVEQWQVRLREMFDIRIPRYVADADTKTSDYWSTHDRVVASTQTLRLDRAGRWERMHQAEPWDLVLVDEAHHMNVDDDGRRTLGFQLAESLQQRGLIQSLILFTGTPHRGKDYGFLSLLKLLRPDDFDPSLPLVDQLAKLRSVMIRNNKQCVTNMAGERLFTPVETRRETYAYSSEEARFYDKLTDFIASGKAYAAGLGQSERRTAILTLITMQKLASSSVAAVRRALAGRLGRLKSAEEDLAGAQGDLERVADLRKEDDPASLDEISKLEERIAEAVGKTARLNPNEIPAIEELLEAANEVSNETKVGRILEIIEESFNDRSVLLFTEYKATQALAMTALQRRYGDGSVTFINGDGYIEGVSNQAGEVKTHRQDRHVAAAQFNRGDVRFLVSTEAAGEGIDLQEHCSALIHVDLPWNPMRLHQRVGRLSRYGQKEPVDVVTVRNPDTVESRIWDLLDQKLERITLAFKGGMEDPEDMRQLVIGMASSSLFNSVFADAEPNLEGNTLGDWFDSQTATFGGEDAVETVRSLVGHAARFDFGDIAGEIPRVDLPDLVPFVKAMLTVRGRRPSQSDHLLEFSTPADWRDDFAIVEHYKLLFARAPQPGPGQDVAGVGLRVLDRALRDGYELDATVSTVRGLDAPLFVFVVRDRVTEYDIRPVVVGAKQNDRGGWTLCRDWEVLRMLNHLADRPRSLMGEPAPASLDGKSLLVEAREAVESDARTNSHFKVPAVEDLAGLLPAP